jgi:quercetin dioxygenase-like cupin family protein
MENRVKKINEKETAFKNGGSGPKYLVKGPKWEGGVIVFKPGQELGEHWHREVEETFYFLQGSPKMIVNGKEHRAREGDVFQLEAGEKHNIINDTPKDTRLIFVKCPFNPEDKVK